MPARRRAMICRVTGCSDSGEEAISALRGQVALRDPRPFVKEPRRGVERLDIDLDDGGAESANRASAAS